MIFKNKRLLLEGLEDYGFTKEDNHYVLNKPILDNQLTLSVTISKSGEVKTKITDTVFDEEYTLHLVSDATGTFVGQVRQEYKSILKDIEKNCFDDEYFRYSQAREVVDYIYSAYGDKPEFLWEDKDTAIFRQKDNGKWYGIIMTVTAAKLGFDSEEKIEIMNIKISPQDLDLLVDNNKYFRAYHMNKKMWTTIVLDGRLSTKEVKERIDNSYNLVRNKNIKKR